MCADNEIDSDGVGKELLVDAPAMAAQMLCAWQGEGVVFAQGVRVAVQVPARCSSLQVPDWGGVGCTDRLRRVDAGKPPKVTLYTSKTAVVGALTSSSSCFVSSSIEGVAELVASRSRI